MAFSFAPLDASLHSPDPDLRSAEPASTHHRLHSRMRSLLRGLAGCVAAASLVFFAADGSAQTPLPLPYTMTTLAGTSPMAAAAGTQCPNLPTGAVSTDAFGDGCLAANAVFGAAGRGGVQVDPFGNVFIADDVNSIIHVINPTSGTMSVLAGGAGATCSTSAGALDSAGDGCLAANQTKTSSPRGIGIDPYGNVYLAGYGDNLIHLVCRAASPLCTAAQIGAMQMIAGCVATTGGSASGGVGLDNELAAQVGVGSCSTAKGEIDQPRGVTADVYGNVYIAETATSRTRVVVGPLTSSYFTGNNPLYAALGVNYASVTQGYIYTVVNIAGTGTSTGGTATTLGQSCSNTVNSTAYTGAALDTYGDGCPFNFSSVEASSGYTSGVAVDASGNMVFTDPTHGLRVLYVNGSGTAGTLMKNAIITNNPGVTPQPGFIYMLWGGGATALGLTPTLGTATAATDTTLVKVTVSPQGNIYIGDSSKVLSYDISTGYIRELYASSANVTTGNFCSGSSGQKSLSAYSDGCAASQSIFSNSNGLGLALDGQNNLYLYDASSSSKMLVRKVLAQGFAARTVGTPQTQNFEVHFPATSAGSIASPTATLTSTPTMTASSVTCGAQNADNSFDCNTPLTSTPTVAGLRSATLTVTAPFTPSGGAASNLVANLSLGGTVTGSALAIDSASTTTGGATTPIAPNVTSFFTGITAAGVALDGAANIYTMDTAGGHFLEDITGTGAVTLPGTLPTHPAQLAVDQLGDVFAVGSGTPSITELAVTGAPSATGQPATLTPTGIAYTPISGSPAPQAIAVDSAGNIFVADKQATTAATAIYRLTLAPNAAAPQVTVATGFTDPVSLAVDPSGNVYVADKAAPAVYKLTPGLVNGVPGYIQTTVAGFTNVVPLAVATDAAGDLYVQDATSLSILEVPVSGPVTTVFTGLTTPTGLAVDGNGDVFSADAASTSVSEIVRNAVAYNFGTSQTPVFAATLTDVGNQSATGSNPVTDTSNFAVVGGPSNGCAFSSSVLTAQAAGYACTLSATFVGSGTGTVSDVLTYLPAASTTGSLTLTGTLQGTAVSTTTTITNQMPANPSYAPTGTEVTFAVIVAATSGTPGGTVAVTVDSTTTNPTLTNGVATVTLSGLTAGTHTIYAAYSTSGSFSASNSGAPLTFTIAQDATATAWSPSTTSVQFGSPVGASTLNAAATYASAAVPGAYVYTANGVEINAATYLAIGSYNLAVTFVPTDTGDYSSSTAPGPTFTVGQASTTAAVGVTQNLVAADGTGNYTSIQTAINALPTTGGSLYLKPGTYNGFVTVVTPNVSIYGLGGNPANVILTNEDGAFSAPFLPGQGVGNNGSSGDQGSATMVVARGTVDSFTGTPSNFYAENFTIQNTYDTDNVNTTTNASVGGTCTANQPAQTFAALYNAGTECNSQALAFWITGDQAVLNNIYTTSQQDTIYAGSISASNADAARQYWFRGKITGDVDYIFGDAAAVFDHTTIYTTYHGTSATGTETIEAQNQADQTGATPSYLSGYIMNSDVFTSQSPGMTNLYFGRPYGHYSTWIMLNSYIDQVSPTGYIEFQGDTNLPTSTYLEYNDLPYTDPATNSPDINGVTYLGAGGSSGSGVTGTRETTSTNPGTVEVASGTTGFQINYPTLANTTLSQAEAQQYYPINFLSTTVPTSPYNTVTNWNPTAAIAAGANAFVPSGTSATVAGGSSVTILIRPQTPGLGAVSNGVYTIPTGGYTLYDTYNGSTTTLASGTLDASGSAYFTSSTLPAGAHSLTWTYTGDSNFAGSTTATAYVLTITGASTTTNLSGPTSPITYGQAAAISATVASASGTPTGSVTLTIDGATTQTATLSAGVATFSVTGLAAGNHSFSASYTGAPTFAASSTTSNLSLTVNPAPMTVTASCANRLFDEPNVCTAAVTGSYQYSDSAATVFGNLPTASTAATRVSPAGNYSVGLTYSLTPFGHTNYTVTPVSNILTVTGGAPQTILFAPLPNFASGASYTLVARSTSGLPVTYSVTSGNASISGTTLTVTAAGPVTITASTAADPTGDYALATPVARSFTAQ